MKILLIKALGGRTIGNGGSEFSVFWGSSNKLDGKYEVSHGKDLAGYLTSEYASRVGDAIRVGVEQGKIAPEIISEN